jgi:hypothetical protein
VRGEYSATACPSMYSYIESIRIFLYCQSKGGDGMNKSALIFIIVIILVFTPLPRENFYSENDDALCSVSRMMKTDIMPFRKKESIVKRLDLTLSIIDKIKPSLHIKYKNVVSRVKFRPQSARMIVDAAQHV